VHRRPDPASFTSARNDVEMAASVSLISGNQGGHDPNLPLRLPYLIFWQVRGLVLLMGRAPPPRMSSSSCCGTRSPSCAAPTHDHAWTGRTGPCSRSSSGGCPRALRCHHLVIPNTILRWHSRLV